MSFSARTKLPRTYKHNRPTEKPGGFLLKEFQRYFFKSKLHSVFIQQKVYFGEIYTK